METQLKTSFSKNIESLSLSIIVLIPFLGILWFMPLDFTSIILILVGIAVLVMPTIYLHINYWENSKGITYIINSNEIILKKSNNIVSHYNKSEFKEIKVYLSSAKYAKIQLGNFAFEDYFYCRIVLDNNSDLILTSLLSKNIEEILRENFSDILITRINDFYPSIR